MALITTKSGDKGMTQLNPDRMASKTHPVIEIMGTIDELSCALGVAGDAFDDIQTFLSELMGYFYYKNVDERRVAQHLWELENYIMGHNNSIPPHFINPRGYVSLARAICRRSERLVVAMMESERAVPDAEKYGMNLIPVIQYLNRLSDYLFVKSFERTETQPELFRDEMAKMAVM
ncbi:MAG: ATP:cob(I)alamin adenosyltransferase [Alphaproteobacteria bacterium]|nr:ATP:cob(I)alamin adenosyltransferase [Alphaproteobacteria bacterium]MDE6570679.1 ATP:cob(I)alamin adenosyltransferase [Alphaproteobacteria bacterium]